VSTPNVTSLPAETTQDERTFAVLAHALQMTGWWIAPLVIFLTKRQSRFVAFHALQALFLQLSFMVIGVVGMVLWFALIFASIFKAGPPPPNAPPPAMLFLFPLVWLVFMGMWVLVLVAAILYSIKAGRGEWAEYPVVGKWARRALKI
jgi:uncharacterized membrane protein